MACTRGAPGTKTRLMLLCITNPLLEDMRRGKKGSHPLKRSSKGPTRSNVAKTAMRTNKLQHGQRAC